MPMIQTPYQSGFPLISPRVAGIIPGKVLQTAQNTSDTILTILDIRPFKGLTMMSEPDSCSIIRASYRIWARNPGITLIITRDICGIKCDSHRRFQTAPTTPMMRLRISISMRWLFKHMVTTVTRTLSLRDLTLRPKFKTTFLSNTQGCLALYLRLTRVESNQSPFAGKNIVVCTKLFYRAMSVLIHALCCVYVSSHVKSFILHTEVTK